MLVIIYYFSLGNQHVFILEYMNIVYNKNVKIIKDIIKYAKNSSKYRKYVTRIKRCSNKFQSSDYAHNNI